MSWTFEYVATENNSAQVVTRYDITDLIGDFEIDWNLGNEFWIKTGDISLEMKSALPFDNIASRHNWFVVNRNNIVFAVFYIGNVSYFNYSYTEANDKTFLFKTRLPSIDQILFERLREVEIGYSAVTTDWNYWLPQAVVTIDRILAKDSTGTYSIDSLNRAGFGLGDMITWLALQSNGFGFNFEIPVMPIPISGDDELPILYRGASRAVTDTDQQIVDHNFTGYGLTWYQVFKMAIFAFNSFVRVNPSISGAPDALSIGVTFREKADPALITTKTLSWFERSYVRYKYGIDGVKLEGGNFEYTQGDIEKGNVLSRDIDVYDPDERVETNSEKLFWSKGDWQSGTSSYSIVSGGVPQPYFKSGLVQPHYAGLISDGHGWTGRIKYNGEQVLDQIDISGKVMQINRLRIRRDDTAKVEGLEV